MRFLILESESSLFSLCRLKNSSKIDHGSSFNSFIELLVITPLVLRSKSANALRHPIGLVFKFDREDDMPFCTRAYRSAPGLWVSECSKKVP
ncbi:hypothetical protein Tco_1112747 [Tanacetum coccineum]|uniref:Uncharacterized protein n=1 Tax=Tanacetum coccineum TaxID=301880 RepID=A0ABQ5IQE8_9ASTR